MIAISDLKARANVLTDEILRLEGALKEVKHLIEWMEKETSSPDADEQTGSQPVEVI